MHSRRSLVVLLLLSMCGAVVPLTDDPSQKKMLDQMEGTLLDLFGMRQRPKADGKNVVIPDVMKEMYRRQNNFYLDTVHIPKRAVYTQSANTVRSFTHIESSIDARFTGHHKFRLKFKVGTTPNEELKAAELILKREKLPNNPTDPTSHFQQIEIYDIVKPGVKHKSQPITLLIDTKLVDTRNNKSLSFDVLPAVERWIIHPRENYGLLIKVLGKGNKGPVKKHLRLRRNAEENWSATQPILFTYTDDGKNKQRTPEEMLEMKRRSRRAVRKPNRKHDKKEPCRRHTMYVDFGDVGWSDWIVAPPGYDAFYCKGECNFPLADHSNTTNHAVVQTLMNSVVPSKVPKTCCVPTQLAAISMLYLDDDRKVVLKNYKEMVVTGCGCR